MATMIRRISVGLGVAVGSAVLCAVVVSSIATGQGKNISAKQVIQVNEKVDCGGVAGIPSLGADIVVSGLSGPANWNTSTGPTNGIVRYSIGTDACNVGSEPVDWYDFGTLTPTLHPVIAQNLYRLKDGRFEQVGMSWLKHGFCALQLNTCDACIPVCQNCCDQLGIGCSDPYSSGLNGDPDGLGPRSQVNPAAGRILIWPYDGPQNLGVSSNDNGQIHVRVEDINPKMNPGAIYFIEGQYVAEDDAGAGNDNNNATWRQVNVSKGVGYPLSYTGALNSQETAIHAWHNNDPSVTLVHVDIPNDGRMTLGYRVTDNGDGTWHYEYAIHNMSSDRSGSSYSVPVSECVNVTNIGFHDVDYHSGDGFIIGTNYNDSDWQVTRENNLLTWETESFNDNPNANALRWGTMYNFRFDADVGPISETVVLGLYKSGKPGSMSVPSLAPEVVDPPACPEDVDPPGGGDGQVNVNDVWRVILTWGEPNGDGDAAPPCRDGEVNVLDLRAVILAWGACP